MVESTQLNLHFRPQNESKTTLASGDERNAKVPVDVSSGLKCDLGKVFYYPKEISSVTLIRVTTFYPPSRMRKGGGVGHSTIRENLTRTKNNNDIENLCYVRESSVGLFGKKLEIRLK